MERITKSIADEPTVPKFNPPFSNGFVSKSPKVAPNGLVNTNANQNKIMCDILVNLYAKTISTNKLAMRIAPPAKPRPELSAKKSPKAVPNVFENKIAIQ